MARLAGHARREVVVDPFPNAAALVAIVPSGEGYEVKIENREGLDAEVIESLLREAANAVVGRRDRAAGAW
jgi:hypothetical protein